MTRPVSADWRKEFLCLPATRVPQAGRRWHCLPGAFASILQAGVLVMRPFRRHAFVRDRLIHRGRGLRKTAEPDRSRWFSTLASALEHGDVARVAKLRGRMCNIPSG